ncbi:MAG TPA: sigma 54-interacting transcriptional regulator [Dongiaceae bacterium]|nr:sigma 54-interacting transcriptional regulator [Dongiaceae bacterium]
MIPDEKVTPARQEILVVEDTQASLRLLADLLTKHGYCVRPASDGGLALKSVAAKAPDLILLDVNTPGMDGYEVCRRLKADERSRRVPIIFISAFSETGQKVKGFDAGGVDYITKPFEPEEVLARVRTQLRLSEAEEALRNARNTLEIRVQERTAELQASNQALRESEEKARGALQEIERLKAQLELENTYLREEVQEAKEFGDIIGKSAALRQLLRQVETVARTDASVLLLGETGTGKELIAREIHKHSRRSDRPLIRVNCASIPRELYESEFFGHARGAFTGALRDRAGRFEAANGGTLLLDEVGEIPLELQSKFLRILQEGQYERVGEERTRSVDVRIIAATNRNLQMEVEAGRFRQDLYYRLNVVPMEVVPLRKRKEDIPLLAAHFLERAARKLKVRPVRLTQAHLAQLQDYDWPGNVRELQNRIERALILAEHGVMYLDLPAGGSPVGIAAVPPTPSARAADTEVLSDVEFRQRERGNVLAALIKTGWKIHGPGGTAELLGLKPTTLISRIKKFGLKKEVHGALLPRTC